MYDDLLGERKKPGKIEEKPLKPKVGKIEWDFDEYEELAYCYACGSNDLTVLKDQLTSKGLEKDIQCNACFSEWREVWNKDIELELKELYINV